ncbi:hypothetical protein EYF80_042925 [Liparis tanakae]|uniref:Uncharacterized protein n=1 Tax=Liparis tanakae TaxID=230148 RepID=A0A4Z2G025_9TELE|nr:hypothetical protein EYF80_042925 [Liparis tanakae]
MTQFETACASGGLQPRCCELRAELLYLEHHTGERGEQTAKSSGVHKTPGAVGSCRKALFAVDASNLPWDFKPDMK